MVQSKVSVTIARISIIATAHNPITPPHSLLNQYIESVELRMDYNNKPSSHYNKVLKITKPTAWTRL